MARLLKTRRPMGGAVAEIATPAVQDQTARTGQA